MWKFYCTNLSNRDDFPSFPPNVNVRYPPPCRTKYAWIYFKIIINKWKMRVMQANIMVMKYVELIQAQIIFNMRIRFCKMWVCFEYLEKCVVAKVVRFPKASIIESSRPRKCFWYDVLHWDLVFNCTKSHRLDNPCGSWRGFPQRTSVDNVEYKNFWFLYAQYRYVLHM